MDIRMCCLFSRYNGQIELLLNYVNVSMSALWFFFFLTGREFNQVFYSVSETEEEEEAALRQPMQLEKEALIDSLLAQKKYVSLFMCRRWQIIILTDALGDLMCDVFQ